MAGCSHKIGVMFVSWKTASYAVMHFLVAIAVAFALTLDWRQALAIGVIEPIVQTVAFAFHDRWWSKREARATDASGAALQS